MSFIDRSDIGQLVTRFGEIAVDVHLEQKPSYTTTAHRAERYFREHGIEFGAIDVSRGCVRNVVFTENDLPPETTNWVRSYELPDVVLHAQD